MKGVPKHDFYPFTCKLKNTPKNCLNIKKINYMLPSYVIGPEYNLIKFEAKLSHLLVK